MDAIDNGILEVVQRVAKQFQKSRKYKCVEKEELENELFVQLKEEFMTRPLVMNTAQQLYVRGMSLACKYANKVEREKSAGYGQSQRLGEVVHSPFDFIETKDRPVPTSRLLDKRKKLNVWCSTRDKRWFKAIDSRVIAYLHFVEDMTFHEIADYFGRTIYAVRTCINAVVRKKFNPVTLKKNDIVILQMDNPFFDKMLGRVKEPTDYGAVVVVESHNYPQRQQWELRCTNSEMVYIGTLDESKLANRKTDEPIPGGTTRKPHQSDQGKYKVVAEVSSELCPKCGGFLVRTGSCLTCQSCGESSGGCG